MQTYGHNSNPEQNTKSNAVTRSRVFNTVSMNQVNGITTGILLGDSLGLPVETLSSTEITERFGSVRTFLSPEYNTLLDGKGYPLGLTSDDTQLSIAMMKAFIKARGFDIRIIADEHVTAYSESTLGWGGSTVAGAQALSGGFFPGDGIFESRLRRGEGNGIPMKIAPLAVWAHRDHVSDEEVTRWVKEVCSLSHPSSLSLAAGLAHVAAIRYCLSETSASFSPQEFIDVVVAASLRGSETFPPSSKGDVLADRLATLSEVSSRSINEIIRAYGEGSCYVFDSLPFSYAFFLRDPYSFESVIQCINAGGDTDSNGALVGALLGALHGPDIFPADLANQIGDLQESLGVAARFFESMIENRVDSSK